jgi:hypothetical protein
MLNQALENRQNNPIIAYPAARRSLIISPVVERDSLCGVVTWFFLGENRCSYPPTIPKNENGQANRTRQRKDKIDTKCAGNGNDA